MILRSITARNFRNLAASPIDFHPEKNLIVGRNGQGKTNLLEAIYFLGTTKSFRTPRLQSIVQFGETSVFASGLLQRGEVARTITVGFELGQIRRRMLQINEERVTLARYVAAMSVFAFSSARLDIIRGTPEERRRFLDRGIASVDPGYLDALSRYGRVLRQRNALLQSGAATPAALDAWDAEFSEAAAAIHSARTAYAGVLSEAYASIVAEHGYHVRGLRLEYHPSHVDDLHTVRRAELRARTTLTGPQRDQLDWMLDGRNAAEVVSAGEQKMVVLFLKFAKLELFRRRFEEPALFLLDDIDAELDLEILQKLLARFPAFTQVFVTSAKERFLAALATGPHRRLTVENGRVMDVADFV
ncbi:MAG TPA: DNA replication and repair protein RecF [Thermoanaerobaculia bacterium]|jgi:DNA replication and repair protein RecF|nr:DNA replication and repair protein RecF [Thermoanaerobaculia bacterium]